MFQNDAGKPLLDDAVKAPEPTVLYDQHIRLADKSHIVPFAGYLMPLWYSSIAEEHAAVREAAGLFDCTHMGVLGISGVGSCEFMNELTTNNMTTLEPGHARYAFILDAAGKVLDDVIVFRKGSEEFILVVNAVNNAKIKDWIEALFNHQVCIEPDHPDRNISGRPKVQDLRIPNGERDYRVDIALQGPRSPEILFALVRDKDARSRMAELKPFQFTEIEIEGIHCMLSGTGYTGSRRGYELFVHPEKASSLWEVILEAGRPLGLLPCGLGARDSLRIEAGFPLYGHELAGAFDISPFEAGYGWAVKLDKAFFIGKAAMERISKKQGMKVARVELPGTKGSRPVRQNDGVLSERGQSIGWVLSCAMIGEKQIALVYVDAGSAEEKTTIGIYYLARSQRQIQQGRKQRIEKDENLKPDLTGRVVRRFAKF